MAYRTLTVEQGTEAWHAERARRFTASEAPCMMGASKYTSRTALLSQKHTGFMPAVSAQKQALFDRGHATEAAARSLLEEVLGDLYPVTAVHETDDRLLASVDGVTFDDSTLFEHKLWSEDLARAVRAGELDPHYYWQLEHQLLVTGAQRVIFVCSDGTRERWAQMEYRPVPGRREALLAGWEQFARDLAAYVPREAAPVTVATPVEALPAVNVRMEGALQVVSNLDALGPLLRAFIDKIPAKPSTDQEFATTDAACKALKKLEEELDRAEAAALGSLESVEKMQRLKATLRDLARTTRLQREKLVEARKLEIRNEEINRGKKALDEIIAGHNAAIGRPYMPHIPADFTACIKGLRTVQSVRDAIDQELARATIAAGEVFQRIHVNMTALREHGADFRFLFNDAAALVLKAPDDCRAVITARIAEHKAEQDRKAAELAERDRERIRQEEANKLRAEQEARDRESARQAAEAARAAQPPAAAPIAPPAVSMQAAAASTPAANVVPMQRTAAPPALAAAQPATLNLGAICDRLGFTVSAEFLKRLGIEPVAVDKAAKKFTDAQFQQLCDALVMHIRAVSQQQRAA